MSLKELLTLLPLLYIAPLVKGGYIGFFSSPMQKTNLGVYGELRTGSSIAMLSTPFAMPVGQSVRPLNLNLKMTGKGVWGEEISPQEIFGSLGY